LRAWRLSRRTYVRRHLHRGWDATAVAESFFSTIKTELLHRHTWPTRGRAHKAIFEWIEGWYNLRRRHSALGYLSPATWEHRARPVNTEQVA